MKQRPSHTRALCLALAWGLTPVLSLPTPLQAQGQGQSQPASSQDDPFSMAQALQGLSGNPERGKALVIARDKGNCLACHELPITEEPFHGSVGPSLIDVGRRLSEGQIRFRVIDQQRINPNTVMPGYYKDPARLNRVLDQYHGKPLLTAQEIEDVVAYLVRLR